MQRMSARAHVSSLCSAGGPHVKPVSSSLACSDLRGPVAWAARPPLLIFDARLIANEKPLTQFHILERRALTVRELETSISHASAQEGSRLASDITKSRACAQIIAHSSSREPQQNGRGCPSPRPMDGQRGNWLIQRPDEMEANR